MMKTSPIIRGLVVVGLGALLRLLLLTVGLGSLLGCGVTLSELQAINPNARTLQVPCRPWQVPKDVKLLAALSSAEYTDHIVSDQTPGELLEYASRANVFIEIKASAPRENAQIMASEYGLICQQDLAVRSTPLEVLREDEPCSMQANTAGKSNYVGTANSQPCNPGAGGPTNGATGSAPQQAKKVQREVRVCAHPPGTDTKLTRWASNDSKGNRIINTYDAFVKAAAEAEIVFIFDETAPPETVYWFVDDPAKLRCKKQPPPKPYAAVKASGLLDMMASAGSMGAALNPSAGSGTGKQQAGSGNAGSGTAGTNTTASSNKGGGKKSDTSSPTGQGKALSIFEQIANGVILAGAIAQGNTSASLDQAGGHRNGMPGGQNVGGFSFPLLQASVGAFHFFSAAGVKPKDFIDIVNAAAKKGQRSAIDKADKEALKLADDLIHDYQQFPMAKGLWEMQTVMPYEMASKFTKGLEGKFQAHKIFERQALKRLNANSDKGFEKLPSVILTKEEHQEITNALAAAWKKHAPGTGNVSPEQLRRIYNDVYAKKYPHWLEIIEKQLR